MNIKQIIAIAIVFLFFMATTGIVAGSQHNLSTNDSLEDIAMNDSMEDLILDDSMDDLTEDEPEELVIEDVEPFTGSIGPGDLLYGLKITFENLDESFTFNKTRKLEKQLEHAELRLAEAKYELEMDRSENAEEAIERFKVKIQTSDDLLSELGNDTSLLDPQMTIAKHQFVLEQLLISNPDLAGLEITIEHSAELGKKFETKTKIELEHVSEDGETRTIRVVQREKTEVEAKISGDFTQVRLKIKFDSDSTDVDVIAREIVDKLQLSKDEIADLLDIKIEDENRRERMEAEAEVEGDISEVEFDYRFPVDATEEDEIIDEISKKLSAVNIDDIKGELEFEMDDVDEVEVEIEDEMDDEDEIEVEDDEDEKEHEEDENETESEDMNGKESEDESSTDSDDDSSSSGSGSSNSGRY